MHRVMENVSDSDSDRNDRERRMRNVEQEMRIEDNINGNFNVDFLAFMQIIER